MSESARSVCQAVRVDGVITPVPLIAKTSQLSYDAFLEVVDGDSPRIIGLITHLEPAGNRPPANVNVKVERLPFIFTTYIADGQFEPEIPEHRNSVKCPERAGDAN